MATSRTISEARTSTSALAAPAMAPSRSPCTCTRLARERLSLPAKGPQLLNPARQFLGQHSLSRCRVVSDPRGCVFLFHRLPQSLVGSAEKEIGLVLRFLFFDPGDQSRHLFLGQ